MSVSWGLLGLPALEVALMGALAGLVGALALVHRRVFFTESLTHATFPGAVAGVVVASAASQALVGSRAGYEVLTLALLVGAVAMCLPMIGLMRWLARVPGLSSQSAAGIVLTFGFALGYFLVKWFAPLPLKVDSFLAGSVLNVSRLDVWVAAYLQKNAESLTVRYIIWQQRIWMAGDPLDGWEAMEDRGSDTQNHMDHVHLSLEVTGEVKPPKAQNSCSGKKGQAATNSTTVSQDGWALPAVGPITSPYGMRINPVTGENRLHSGTDLGGGGCQGAIWAAQSGTVVTTGFDSAGNGTIIIDHGGGVQTAYLHMYESGILVHEGDRVTAGQQIGLVGSSGNSTGCHLHYEVIINGTTTDPVPFMAKVGITLG